MLKSRWLSNKNIGKKMKKIKSLKPKNHVFLAMSKRSGAGTHQKNNKSIRIKDKDILKKTINKSYFDFKD